MVFGAIFLTCVVYTITIITIIIIIIIIHLGDGESGGFYSFNFYFRSFITSIMLFGESSGQKSLKLKMDKICRPGPFRMTRPIFIIIQENFNGVREDEQDD